MSPRPRQSDAVTSEQAHQLVEATFRVIARAGDTEPDVRSILREAGLSRPALYRCFGSKDGLMVAVLEEGRRLLADYLSARMARASTPAGALRAFIEGFVRQAEDKRSAERTRPFVTDPGRRAVRYPVQHRDTELVLSGLIERTIVDGVEQGLFESCDPAKDALVIYDAVLASVRRHLMLGVTPTRADARALANFSLRALGAHELALSR